MRYFLQSPKQFIDIVLIAGLVSSVTRRINARGAMECVNLNNCVVNCIKNGGLTSGAGGGGGAGGQGQGGT